jgi:hypothetical protein
VTTIVVKKRDALDRALVKSSRRILATTLANRRAAPSPERPNFAC